MSPTECWCTPGDAIPDVAPQRLTCQGAERLRSRHRRAGRVFTSLFRVAHPWLDDVQGTEGRWTGLREYMVQWSKFESGGIETKVKGSQRQRPFRDKGLASIPR